MDDTRTKEPLAVVARKIEEHAEKSDEHVLKAAELVAEARRRVDGGDAGDITWYAWAPKNIKLSLSRLRDLQRVAEADEPAKELRRQRNLTQKRVEKHRAKAAAKKSSLEPERKRLIAWAKTAPIDDVKRVLDQVASNDNVAGSSDETPDTESQHAA